MKSFRGQFTVQFSCVELFRVYFRSIGRNLLFLMRKWFWISDQFEVLKEKQWLQSNSKRTKCYLWLVCNREVWAPGTTDENSFLITSLTNAFSIHRQAFNGYESSWKHSVFLAIIHMKNAIRDFSLAVSFWCCFNFFSLVRGTQRQFSGKYLFGRRFEI